MNHIHRKNPFWSVAGPLIAYWGIQIGVQFIIQAIIQVPMMTSAYLEQFLNGQITNSEEMMESYLSVIGPAMEAVMKYETEITGAAALCTLPLTLILFRRDRKLEKVTGFIFSFIKSLDIHSGTMCSPLHRVYGRYIYVGFLGFYSLSFFILRVFNKLCSNKHANSIIESYPKTR